MNRYTLKYPSEEEAKKPLLAMAVSATGVLVNILAADVEYSRGQMIISVIGDEKKERLIIGYLRKHGVEAKKLTGKIRKDKKLCMDCCACYGVCPTKAITIRDDRMRLDNNECIGCMACVKVCPVKALTPDKN
jgi:L-aspartate semialdehyde sulfurtransferase ferredoxin